MEPRRLIAQSVYPPQQHGPRGAGASVWWSSPHKGRNTLATNKKTSVPPEQLELYERLVEAAGIDSKSNFGSAYTAVNGNMYSMISKYGVVGIRLPDEEREAFIEEYDTEMFRADPSWPPSKNMVAVPGDLLEDTEALAPYLKRSYEYTQTLKPKPTKKKTA